MNLFKKEDNNVDSDLKIINQIRGLGLDIINNYGKGDEGVVLSSAPILYTLFSKHLCFNPKDSKYLNRDRLVVTSSNIFPLLYATLYMAGFPYTIDDLKNFDKIGCTSCKISKNNLENIKKTVIDNDIEKLQTNNVNIEKDNLLDTDIKLQTISNDIFNFCSVGVSVGIAIAEEYLRNYFTSKKIDLINHYTYVLVNDNDLMNGISYEAASLAGNLKLNKLIFIHDNSSTTTDGNSDLTFKENITERFKAVGWNTIEVNNSEDTIGIDKAISFAKDSDKPTLISIKTTLGKFSKYEDSNLIHEHILTKEEISEIKNKLELRDINFTVSSELMETFQEQIKERNITIYEEFNKKLECIDDIYLNKLLNNDLTINLGEIVDITDIDSTTNYSNKVLNSIDDDLFMSSSCDKFKYCKNYLEDKGDFSLKNRLGKNIFGGSRESLMSDVGTGLTLMGIRNVISNTLHLSNYMLPMINYSASLNIPNIYIFTDDANDCSNFQIDNYFQIDILSNIPNVEVFVPKDLNEVIGTYKTIFNKNTGVSIIILSNEKVNTNSLTNINDTSLGAYILKEEEGIPFLNLIACGKKIDDILELEQRLLTKGIFSRVISMPSFNRFTIQNQEYKNKVIDVNEKTFVINLNSSMSNYNNLKNLANNIYFLNDKNEELNIDNLERKIEELL